MTEPKKVDNGKRVLWPQLWVVVTGVLAISTAISLFVWEQHNALPTHEGAFTRQEQRQYEKRRDAQFIELSRRLDRIEDMQEEILRRMKD